MIGEWRPMKSAPKDGTRIELWLSGPRKIHIGFWCHIPMLKSEWFVEGAGRHREDFKITHWRPLRSPPVRGGRRKRQ